MLKRSLIDGLLVAFLVAVGSVLLDRERVDEPSVYVFAIAIGAAYAFVNALRARRRRATGSA